VNVHHLRFAHGTVTNVIGRLLGNFLPLIVLRRIIFIGFASLSHNQRFTKCIFVPARCVLSIGHHLNAQTAFLGKMIPGRLT
jgi:hypothetical protein